MYKKTKPIVPNILKKKKIELHFHSLTTIIYILCKYIEKMQKHVTF